jgi:hypothetical protein
MGVSLRSPSPSSGRYVFKQIVTNSLAYCDVIYGRMSSNGLRVIIFPPRVEFPGRVSRGRYKYGIDGIGYKYIIEMNTYCIATQDRTTTTTVNVVF